MAAVNNLSEVFKNNLRNLIVDRGITQKELADYLRVSPATISHWLAGQKLPRMNKIDKLCEFFLVDRSALLEKDPSRIQYRSVLLDADEIKIIDNYRTLNGYNRLTANNILALLNSQQANEGISSNHTQPSGGIIQNNLNHNLGGTNFVAIGGGNNYNTVAP